LEGTIHFANGTLPLKKQKNGTLETLFINRKKNHKLPYTTKLESQFPGFLHETYKYATLIASTNAQLNTVLAFMEDYAKRNFPYCRICHSLSMSKHHFYKFFYGFKGKFHEPRTTKPQLNSDQIKARLNWAIKWKEWCQLSILQKHCCFLNEKWFYISS
jgi:midasin (ATPase involved in ribosome maturation)